MKINKLRMLASQKGFTLIELMIVIAIIGILAAVAIPNFIEYKNKSYCTATVNDVGAIGGALADYFANPMNVTATTYYTAGKDGARPFITVGDLTPRANTLLLSASTSGTDNTVADELAVTGAIGEVAGAYKSGSNYHIFATEGAGNCPLKLRSTDTHWTAEPNGEPNSYFKTL